jgi:large subunit ribosomal protein L24
MTARVRKGDVVAVRSGDDAGKRGRVLRVLPEAGRAVVEGVNLQFKHLKRTAKNPRGGRVHKEAPVPLSSLMPIDPKTDKPTRVGSRVEDGRRVRVAVGSGEPLDAEPRRAKRGKGEAAAKEPARRERKAAKEGG